MLGPRAALRAGPACRQQSRRCLVQDVRRLVPGLNVAADRQPILIFALLHALDVLLHTVARDGRSMFPDSARRQPVHHGQAGETSTRATHGFHAACNQDSGDERD